MIIADPLTRPLSLNRTAQRLMVPSLSFLKRSQRPGHSQDPPVIAATSLSFRVRLERCPEQNVTRILESIWRLDVAAEAKETSERPRIFFTTSLEFLVSSSLDFLIGMSSIELRRWV
ncbi:hypothetical protein HZ326_29097 [Fusarium oxysporum f. sp. albedinis]|nr:hypothetical protein HZ326_29097 [Fusarium oxysporum f. sp. albedinis]